MQVLLEIAILLATVGFVLYPLIGGKQPQNAAGESSLEDSALEIQGSPSPDDLAARRDALLDELQELEFDREMGKVTNEDYNRIQAGTAGAIEIAQQRIAAGAAGQLVSDGAPRASSSAGAQTLVDREIEAEVLVARARLAKKAGSESTP